MAKTDTSLWEQAKGMFEVGKSMTFISDSLGIDRTTISKRAKREGWEKGKFTPLIIDSVRIHAEIHDLDSTVKQIVNNEIDERTKHLTLITNATHVNINRMMMKFDRKSKEYQTEMSIMDNKLVQSTIKDARESLLGKEQTPTTAVQINNNIKEVVHRVLHVNQ